ncbi:hypothetical protein D3C78_1266570 [compost metagenome]
MKEFVSLSLGYGFFEIDFKEDDREYNYGIVYTVYDGVIIANYSGGGGRYRNEHLAGLVHGLFTK